MATATSFHSLVPSTTPIHKEDTSQELVQPAVSRFQLSARDRYVAEAEKRHLIDEKGNLILDDEGQTEIDLFWQHPLRFIKDQHSFTWSFHTFLSYLVPYFSSKPFDGVVELQQGTLHVVGENIWKRCLEPKIDSTIIEESITSEMWKFCTRPPRCYTFHIRLPQSANLNQEHFELFPDVATYFFAVQALPNPPKLFDAIREYGALKNQTPPTEEKYVIRMQELRTAMAQVEPCVKKSCSANEATLEIAFIPETSLKIVFTTLPYQPASFLLDDLRLQLHPQFPAKLSCSQSAWMALHDHLLNRLTPLNSLDQEGDVVSMLGRYWAHLTCAGHVFQGLDLEKRMIDRLIKGKTPLVESLKAALAEGESHLPPGQEALLAYRCNAFHFLHEHGVDSKDLPSKSPAWRLAGMLQASLPTLSQCRKTAGRDQLEVCLSSGYYVVLPWDFENTLPQLTPEQFPEFSDALAEFFPENFQFGREVILRESSVRLEEIYRTFREDERFSKAATTLMLILVMGGWKQVDEHDILEMPRWLSTMNTTAQEQLSLALQNSSFYNLFCVLKDQKNQDDRARLLLSCSDVKVLSLAWKRYIDVCTPQFLLENASQIAAESLPFALNRVCALCKREKSDLSAEERTQLLTKYLGRLMQLPDQGRLLSNYGPKLYSLRPDGEKGFLSQIESLNQWLDSGELISLSNAEATLGKINDVLSYFVQEKDMRIVSKIKGVVACIKGAPKERVLWAKCAELVENLSKEDLFLETTLELLEDLSNQEFLKTKPPLLCFKRGIPQVKIRLSDAQQLRLARVYLSVVTHLEKEAEPAILAALPPMNWMREVMMRDETWQGFAGLFLRLSTRRSDAKQKHILEEAAQLSSRLFSGERSPLLSQFVEVIGGVPIGHLGAEWKPHLFSMIIQDPRHHSALKIFGHLLKLTTGAERKFVERCQTLHKQGSIDVMLSSLTDYQTTHTLPEEKAAAPQHKRPLSPQVVSLQRKVKKVAPESPSPLEILKSKPPETLEEWDIFLKALPISNSKTVLEAVWKAWIKSHPYASVKPEEADVWALALWKCLGSHEMVPAFTEFLRLGASLLMQRVDGEGFRKILKVCLKIGINDVWIEPMSHPDSLFNVLERVILADEKVASIQDVWTLVDRETSIRMNLLLARQPANAAQFVAQFRFVTRLSGVEASGDYSSDENVLLFRNFCDQPFVPSDTQGQALFFEWIEKSWGALKSTLSDTQVCTLIQCLGQFNYTSSDQERVPLDLDKVFNKLQDFVMGTWKMQSGQVSFVTTPSPSPITRALFFEAIFSLMDAAITLDDREAVFRYYNTMRRAVSIYAVGIFESSEPSYLLFRFRWVSFILDNVHLIQPEACISLKNALVDMKGDFKYMAQGGPVAYKNLERFIVALPHIFNLSATHDDLIPMLTTIFDELMQMHWVMVRNTEDQGVWEYILFVLCKCVKQVNANVQEPVIQFVIQVFKNSTHPNLLQQKTKNPTPTLLVMHFTPILAMELLALRELDVLTASAWKSLFEGILPGDIEKMTALLMADLNKNISNQKSLALARIVCHHQQIPEMFLAKVENSEEGFDSLIPVQDIKVDMLLQICNRLQWILACRRLLEKKPLEMIQNQKKLLIPELTFLVRSQVKDEETYRQNVPYLLRAIGSEAELALIMQIALLDTPADHPLMKFKEFLAKRFPN